MSQHLHDFSVDRIDHAALTVRNLERSAAWYSRVLGLEPQHRWDPHPWMIGRGGTAIALFECPQGEPLTELWDRLAFQHLAFRVEPANFEAAQQRLHECGIPFDGPVDHDIATSVYFRDPDGHRLEITCYPTHPR